MDMNTFMKHRYIGEDNERQGYVKGEEYHRVRIGSSFYNNTYGVYVTSESYSGSDIDYCNFIPVRAFNALFIPPIPLSVTPAWEDRGHKQYLKRKRKLRIARANFGTEFVEESIKDGTASKLYNMSYKCRCIGCEMSRSHKVLSKVRDMDDAMNEYLNQEQECV